MTAYFWSECFIYNKCSQNTNTTTCSSIVTTPESCPEGHHKPENQGFVLRKLGLLWHNNSNTIILVSVPAMLPILRPERWKLILYMRHLNILKNYPLMSITQSKCYFLPKFINPLKPTGYVMHQQFNIQQLYALPTPYLCVLYLSQNRQRLVPLTS